MFLTPEQILLLVEYLEQAIETYLVPVCGGISHFQILGTVSGSHVADDPTQYQMITLWITGPQFDRGPTHRQEFEHRVLITVDRQIAGLIVRHGCSLLPATGER
jgi:hypothetical protein